MKVAFLPVYANPYQRLLAGGLARQGVEVTMLPGLPSAGWLRANRATTDLLHFHWLYGLYMAHWRTPRQVAAFLHRLRLPAIWIIASSGQPTTCSPTATPCARCTSSSAAG